MNIELPNDESLKAYAPEKSITNIKQGLAATRARIDDAREARRRPSRTAPPRFAPAGQSTQMVIGADGATDLGILSASAALSCVVRPEARLLFRVQPNRASVGAVAHCRHPASARASALPG